ncbi:hypothetical protein BH23THE1_BH23THE1_30310 [soil metagenome]
MVSYTKVYETSHSQKEYTSDEVRMNNHVNAKELTRIRDQIYLRRFMGVNKHILNIFKDSSLSITIKEKQGQEIHDPLLLLANI